MWCETRSISMNKKASFVLMYVSFLIYSASSILSKIASTFDFLSMQYILCFCGIIFILGIYAVLWQQVLKSIPLSVAMSHKPVVLILSLLWAVLLFKENISLDKLGGICLILLGVFIIGLTNNVE